jgi:hypothetical protein
MKHTTFDSFAALMDDVARAFGKLARRAGHTIGAMSWPALAVTCVALALALTIVPLALFLFVVFMIVKLALAAIVVNTRRGKATPYRDAGADTAAPAAPADKGDGA